MLRLESYGSLLLFTIISGVFSAAAACSVWDPNREKSYLITSTGIAVTWVQTGENLRTHWYDIDTRINVTGGNWGPKSVGLSDTILYAFSNMPGEPHVQHCFWIWTSQSPNGCRSDNPSEWICLTQTTPPPGREIVLVTSNKCIDVPGGDAANPNDGDNPQIYGCWGGSNQKWTFENGMIESKGKCLEVPNGTTVYGTYVILHDCWGGHMQKWIYQDGQLKDQHGNCLTALTTDDKAKLVIWLCEAAYADRQYWVIR